jgi:hypothetical protein
MCYTYTYFPKEFQNLTAKIYRKIQKIFPSLQASNSIPEPRAIALQVKRTVHALATPI